MKLFILKFHNYREKIKLSEDCSTAHLILFGEKNPRNGQLHHQHEGKSNVQVLLHKSVLFDSLIDTSKHPMHR